MYISQGDVGQQIALEYLKYHIALTRTFVLVPVLVKIEDLLILMNITNITAA